MALILRSGSRIGHFEEQIVWECLLNVFLRKGLRFHFKFLHQIPWITFGHQLQLLYTAHLWAYGKSIRRHFIEWCISQYFTRTSGVENHWRPSFSILGPLPCPSVTCNCQKHGLRALSSASSSNTELLFQIITGGCCHFITYATCLHTPWLFKKSFEVKSAKAIANMELIKSIYA